MGGRDVALRWQGDVVQGLPASTDAQIQHCALAAVLHLLEFLFGKRVCPWCRHPLSTCRLNCASSLAILSTTRSTFQGPLGGVGQQFFQAVAQHDLYRAKFALGDWDRLRKVEHQPPHGPDGLRRLDDRPAHPRRASFRAGWLSNRTSCLVSTGCRRSFGFAFHLARERSRAANGLRSEEWPPATRECFPTCPRAVTGQERHWRRFAR